MQTILRTGFGLAMKSNQFETLSIKGAKGLLMKHGFMLVSGLNLDREKLINIAKSYGSLNEYVQEKRKSLPQAHCQLLELDGNTEKIISGRGELPFHADGSLLKSVDHIFLYASEIDHLKFQGGTIVVDNATVFEEMPLHLRRVLEEEKFETLGVENGYYAEDIQPDWFQVNAFTDLGWTRKYHVYSNFQKDPSWITRVKGFSDAEVKRFFDELDNHFRNPKYSYLHHWTKGDLLIMDNRRTFHAREAFSKESKRILFRIQTREN